LTHFFLRANAARTAIKPNKTPWVKKRRFRFFGPSDLELINISPPILQTKEYEPEDKDKISSLTDSRVEVGTLSSPIASSPESNILSPSKPRAAVFRSNWPLLDDMERPPTPAKPMISQKDATKKLMHKKQSSYSLFPGGDDMQLPPSVYSPEKKDISSLADSSAVAATALTVPSLLPPLAPFSANISRDSTATLQIGMRFSSAPAAAAAARPSSPNKGANRPSLRTVIDNMIKDPFLFKSDSLTPVDRSSLLQPHNIASYTQERLKSTDHPRLGSVETFDQPNDYDWLDLQEKFKSPTSITSTSKRGSLLPSRKESQRRLAESNRSDLAALERSGSGASRARLRPAYPNPATPDTSPQSARNGFF
jgi:hypothetical protein